MSTATVADSYKIFEGRKESELNGYHRIGNEISNLPDTSFTDILSNVPKKIPIWEINDTIKLETKKPIGVMIRRGEELILAENETLGIYAYGETVNEAIKDFTEQLIEYYEHYTKAKESDLTEKALKIKQLYSNLFKVRS